jgi:hypothetical protein
MGKVGEKQKRTPKIKDVKQSERFREAARELGADEDSGSLDRIVRQMGKKDSDPKVCPECQHVFQGNGWDGIDAHWRAAHEKAMPYEKAWPLIKVGAYRKGG